MKLTEQNIIDLKTRNDFMMSMLEDLQKYIDTDAVKQDTVRNQAKLILHIARSDRYLSNKHPIIYKQMQDYLADERL